MRSPQESDIEQWNSASGWHVAALAACVAYIAWQHLFTDSQWVMLLDHTNLALHEAGHPAMGLFSSRLAVYGGSVFQLLFPAAFTVHFWRQRHALGTAMSFAWFAENLLNIGRYMQDARSHLLPLVGGGDHDWTEIFTRWGVLSFDTQIGAFTRLIGFAMMLLTLIWMWQRWRQNPIPSR